ncbi:MAG: argininosuccinate lyase [Actinomycetia bacterium]|nr:argininosuccinate lyase [Actinomycetes bacterium]
MAFTESLSFDQKLWADDIAGSLAHVAGLAHAGIISDLERDLIVEALHDVAGEMAAGTFVFGAGDEDIHTAVERRVTEIAGPAGAKLHTGRSRNDQSATDVRRWMKRELAVVAGRIVDLQEVLIARAEQAEGVYLPGYTHLQRAQPVLLAHHLLAHGWALGRDVARILDALVRIDVSPLGAGALAGSSLPLDPDFVATELAFAARFENSMDAVGSRDHVAEALFALTMVAINLSRIGEEFVLWTSEEFGFATLDDGYATGSSMLPQKKNPDIAELARGKAGRAIGNLTGFLATMKGLPLSYNRDYQEDKEPLFDAVEQVTLALGAVSGMIATAKWNTERMQQAADAEVNSATDLAEWLVQRGTPFRDAHSLVGKLVRRHVAGEGSLRSLVEAEAALGPDAAALVAPGVAVQRRTTPGGAGPAAVATQMLRFKNKVHELREAVAAYVR